MPPRVKRALALLDAGDPAGALRLLREQVRLSPRDRRCRWMLAKLLSSLGRLRKAIAVLKAGLHHEAADYPLLMLLGELYEQQSRDGLTVRRTGDFVVWKAGVDPKAEAAFKRKAAQQAEATYRAALKARPDSLEAAEGVARMLGVLGRKREAVRVWRILVAARPSSAALRLNLARAMEAAGMGTEATRAYQRVVALNPRAVAAHEALSRLYRAAGQPAKARHHAELAQFYGWLPPFLKLRPTPQLRRRVSVLLGKSPKKKAEVARALLADASQESSGLLAALCWHHAEHGALERKAFAALEARRATGLLLSLLKQPRSVCTIRQAAAALARLKAPGLLAHLTRLLPRDRRIGFPMRIPRAMALLGDARAVPILTRVALRPVPASVGKQELGDMAALAWQDRRERAVLALGRFPVAAAVTALNRAARDPKVAGYAEVALYLQDHRPEHLKRARQWFVQHKIRIAPYVEESLSGVAAPAAKAFLRFLQARAKRAEERTRP